MCTETIDVKVYSRRRSGSIIKEPLNYETTYRCARKDMKVSLGYCEFCMDCGPNPVSMRPLKACQG